MEVQPTRRLSASGAALSLLKRDAFVLRVIGAVRDRGGEAVTSEPDRRGRLWTELSIVVLTSGMRGEDR